MLLHVGGMSRQGENAMPDQRANSPLLQVKNLKVYFPTRHGLFKRQTGLVKAVDDISFEIYKGETLGLVGESGCGKTTTGRAIVRLQIPSAGKIFFEGSDLAVMNKSALRQRRQYIRMIFQDPYSSLNPRMTIGDIVGESLIIHRLAKGKAIQERVENLLELVGVNPLYSYNYPHELSGGQRQRVGIARALASDPSFIVCDEPISSLDVSIQAQIVNLLKDLQLRLGLTYLFIAHDLSMVHHISNRVAVMYLGQLMELAPKHYIYMDPLHPYTLCLLSAVPLPNPRVEKKHQQIILEGEIPSPANPPSGCRFSTRCPLAVEICKQVTPEFREVRPGHFSACHRVDERGADTGLPKIGSI
jgi:oligopeptide transport system ATP-binding protein